MSLDATPASEQLYRQLALQGERLPYRDKLRLAQLLLQTGRKEEEQAHPSGRSGATSMRPCDPGMIDYVALRLRKLRPARRNALLNAISAMFQFRGGVSEPDRDTIVAQLVLQRVIAIDQDGRVEFIATR